MEVCRLPLKLFEGLFCLECFPEGIALFIPGDGIGHFFSGEPGKQKRVLIRIAGIPIDQKNSEPEGLGVNFVFVPRIRSGIKVVKMDFLLLLIIARPEGTVNCL